MYKDYKRDEMIGNIVGIGLNIGGRLLAGYIASKNPTAGAGMAGMFGTPCHLGGFSHCPNSPFSSEFAVPFAMLNMLQDK